MSNKAACNYAGLSLMHRRVGGRESIAHGYLVRVLVLTIAEAFASADSSISSIHQLNRPINKTAKIYPLRLTDKLVLVISNGDIVQC